MTAQPRATSQRRHAQCRRSRASWPITHSARLAAAEEIRHAAPAQRRVRAIGADVGAPVPAALALRAARSASTVDRERRRRAATRACRGDRTRSADRRRAKRAPRSIGAGAVDRRPRPAATSRSCPACRSALELLQHGGAHGEDLRPIWRSARPRPAPRGTHVRATRARRSSASFGCRTRHASSAVNERIGAISFSSASRMMRERGLRRAPRAAVARRRVEPVLQHVEVEAAQVLGAERLQPLHDEVELVAVVVGRCTASASARAAASA